MEPERLCREGILSQGRSLCRGHLGTEAWMAQGNGAKHRSAGRVFGMVGTTVQLSQGRARPTGPRDSKEEEESRVRPMPVEWAYRCLQQDWFSF